MGEIVALEHGLLSRVKVILSLPLYRLPAKSVADETDAIIVDDIAEL